MFVRSAVGRPRWSLATLQRLGLPMVCLRRWEPWGGSTCVSQRRLQREIGGGSGGGPRRRAHTRVALRPHPQRPWRPPPSPWPLAPQAMPGCSSKVSPITLHLFLQIMQQQGDWGIDALHNWSVNWEYICRIAKQKPLRFLDVPHDLKVGTKQKKLAETKTNHNQANRQTVYPIMLEKGE
jgi:hypothetical protein